MKRIFCVAVFLCIAMTLAGASKTRCRNCGINDGNIIFMCEKQHITCSKCSRGRTQAEAFSDNLAAAFGGGSGSSMRCTKVNRYDNVCNANITRKIADNRSAETIRREQAAARQRAENAAKAKAAKEQKEQAGIKVLRAEHAKMLAAFRSALKSKSPATLKQTVAAMLKHHDNHDGYASKASGGIFGMFGGRSGGEKCNILNVMVSTALKLNDEKQISIIFANINPGDGVVLSGLGTGKTIYVKLFAGKLKNGELFCKAVPVIVETHCRLKNPAYIAEILSTLKTTSFSSYDLRNSNYCTSSEGNQANEIIFTQILAQNSKLPFAAMKPLYDDLPVEKLESILTQAVADGDTVTYKYLIDKRKVTGSAAIRKNDLAVYPYHLLIAGKDYVYAEKVKISPTMHEDKIEVWKEEQKSYSSNSKTKEVKRNKATVPVAYMAELNNFDAVKYLIEKEGYDFGSLSTYAASDDARTWAKKHNNKEMYKYMDDKISGWATAGYYTVNILLFPLMILALAAAK